MELLHEQYLALDPENKQQVNLHFLRTFQEAGFEEQKSVLILMYIWLNNFLTQSEFAEDLRARVQELHKTVTGEPGILFTIAQDTSNLTDAAGKPVPEWDARTEGVAPTLRDQMQIMGIRFDIRDETVPTYIFHPDLLRHGTYADLMAFLINHLYGTIDIVRQPTASILKRTQPSVYEVTSLADPFAQLRAAELTVATLTQMARHPLFVEQYPDIAHGLIKAIEKQKGIVTGLRRDLGLPATDEAMISAATKVLENFVTSADEAAFSEDVKAGQVREVGTPHGPVYLLQEHSHMGAEDAREFEHRLNGGPGLNKDYVYDLLASYSESGILQSLREDVVAYRKFIRESAGHAIVFAQEATPGEITISGSLRENYLAIAEHLRSAGIYEQKVIDAVYLLVQGVEAFLIGSGELHEDDVIFLPMEDEIVKAQENEALKRLLMSQREFYHRAEELAYSDQVIQLLDVGMGDYIYAADQTQAEQVLVHGIFAHTRDPQLLQIIKRRLYWVQHVLANGINRRNLYMARSVLASVQPHHKMIISVGQLHVD
ncbi:MAG: hypothetical protein K8I00_10670, partial [Candidatus Omnitrophica bacterium]|nr:hypothetical protein [Candidatus Omnitrophota bacterium]